MKFTSTLSISIRALLLPLLVLSLGAPVVAQGQPKAVIDQPIHDFGVVGRGQKVDHTFVIQNQGDAPLEFREIQAPCACTVVKELETIPPGKSGRLEVALDTATLVGPSSRRVSVFTNDPANPRLDLTLKVEAEPWVLADPGYVRYIVVQAFDVETNDPTLTQRIYARKGADFEIKSARSDFDGIGVTYRRANDDERDPEIPGPQWLVETRIDPKAPVGPITGYLNLEIDHPEQPALAIPISGFVRPVFALTPSRATFGQVNFEDGKPVVGRIKVQNFATESIAITKVEDDVEGLDAEIEVDQDGRIYYLVLKLDPEMPKGDFEGTVRLATDSPRAPLLELPVSGAVH